MSRLVKCTREEIEYLDPVFGQLSDGKWENSARMEPYWMCNSLTDKGIEMERQNSHYGRKTYWNPLYDMTDEQVRFWFADKLKAVVKDWLKDNGYKAEDWSRVNNDKVDYLRSGQTVAGAYKVYDSLKGRESQEGKQVKVKTVKKAIDLEPGDQYGKAKVVEVIKPLTPRDTVITIVLDNDEVVRIPKTSTLEVVQIKTIE